MKLSLHRFLKLVVQYLHEEEVHAIQIQLGDLFSLPALLVLLVLLFNQELVRAVLLVLLFNQGLRLVVDLGVLFIQKLVLVALLVLLFNQELVQAVRLQAPCRQL